jgi:hypothetical protein
MRSRRAEQARARYWCEANTPPLVGTSRWSLSIGLPGREAQRIQQTRAAFIVDRQSPGSIPVLLFAGCDNAFRHERSRVSVMSEKAHFTAEEARAAGERVGIDWALSRFDVEQFRIGMDVELEHGTHDEKTNVTDDDVAVTAKIARAHLNEFPDYYSRLAVMEAEAKAYWDAQDE